MFTCINIKQKLTEKEEHNVRYNDLHSKRTETAITLKNVYNEILEACEKAGIKPITSSFSIIEREYSVMVMVIVPEMDMTTASIGSHTQMQLAVQMIKKKYNISESAN